MTLFWAAVVRSTHPRHQPLTFETHDAALAYLLDELDRMHAAEDIGLRVAKVGGSDENFRLVETIGGESWVIYLAQATV